MVQQRPLGKFEELSPSFQIDADKGNFYPHVEVCDLDSNISYWQHFCDFHTLISSDHIQI